jgi:hypothetical protein
MSRLSVLAIVIVILASCGESSLLTPELSQDEQIGIQTVDDGALLSPTEAILVSVERRTPDGSAADPLDGIDAELTDGRGTLVHSTRIDGTELEAVNVPPLELPDLEPGRYQLSLSARRDGEPVATTTRTIFVVENPEAFGISGIATYPPSLAPKRRGVAQASVSAPAGARPWLRWTLDGGLIHEGYLADGADQATIEAPEGSGAYSLSLELFPHGRPPAGYTGPAPVRQKTRLFVRSAGAAADRALGPGESYFALFHFDGSAEDSGVGGDVTGGRGVEAEVLGDAQLRVSDRLFGYELGRGSGFEVSGLLVPFRGGVPSRFSLNFRLRADELAGTSRILGMRASDSGFALELTVDEEGLPTLFLETATASAESRPREPLFSVGEPLDLSIAVVPGRTATRVRWYAGGDFISESRLAVTFPRPEPDAEWQRRPGVTRIGGENGFVGIIDEFGVYFRDEDGEPAVYTEMYRDARRRELGSTLVYAEGFDAGELPPETTARGAVRTEQGILVLGPDASLALPSLPFNGDVILIEVAVPEASEAAPVRLAVYEEDRMIFTVDSTGTLEDWQGGARQLEAVSPLRLRLSRVERAMSVSVGAQTVSVPVRSDDLGEIDLRLLGPRESGVTRIESVLAYHEAERVAATEDAP